MDENGEQAGLVTIQEALERAENAELDLVEVAPNAKPPVCKLMDYSKYKYEKAKKAKEAKKNKKLFRTKKCASDPILKIMICRQRSTKHENFWTMEIE